MAPKGKSGDAEKKPAGEKKVNGLTKPMSLSADLAAIVGAKKDEKLARSEIIKRLWAYLKEKKLQVRYLTFFHIILYKSNLV